MPDAEASGALGAVPGGLAGVRPAHDGGDAAAPYGALEGLRRDAAAASGRRAAGGPAGPLGARPARGREDPA